MLSSLIDFEKKRVTGGQSRGDSVQDTQFWFNDQKFVKLVINHHLADCIQVIFFFVFSSRIALNSTICSPGLET